MIAETFGDDGPTWELTPPVDGARLDVLDEGRRLRLELLAATELPGAPPTATLPCAWTRGDFVDVDARVSVVFESATTGVGVGFWLRRSDASHVQVLLFQDGSVTATFARSSDGRTTEARLGTIERSRRLRLGTPMELRARLVRDVLTIYLDGVPSGSMLVPADMAGHTSLYVQIAGSVRTQILLSDPLALLP
ncbi:hypothetical protein A7982_13206 [Minicystis rosea]|nr:hypothetical protein A7982_13206 [Minicystis rosea]